MSLNVSKRTQKYIQNDPMWAQNRLKWGQMSKPINELKSG